MKILDEISIQKKTTRLAFQIAENNYQCDEIILAGINNNGFGFAKLLEKQLKKIVQTKVTVSRIKLNPANPLAQEAVLDTVPNELRNKTIIIVDDVANTGRTIFYAFQPLLKLLPFKLEVAVLVDRKHKLFPIHVDYVGLSIATTMKENIIVKIIGVEEMEVHLE